MKKDKSRTKHCLLSWSILVALLLNLTVLLSVFSRLKEKQFFDLGEEEEEPKDLLGGLLPPGFEEGSCQSRHQSVHYLKGLKRPPSPHLLSKLRSYEALHRRCGPHTESYNRTVKLIESSPSAPTECRYVLWSPFAGLGNRMLTMASAFLYSLLTNRVLMVDFRDHTPDLFCDPFPGTSWFLPQDFPLVHYLGVLNKSSSHCHGYMVKNHLTKRSSRIPPFVYLNLIYDMDRYDETFFLEGQEQTFLNKVPWLFMSSDEYFIPSLFMMQSFSKELGNMFPDKDAVFHLLGRYLFHPTDLVWGMITRYHRAYLAGADEKIGIQIREFEGWLQPQQHILNQIMACISTGNILPRINEDDYLPDGSNARDQKNKTKVVLVTSLVSGYADRIRLMYTLYPTETGEVVRVHEPSQEEHQKMSDLLHYVRALAEIYLIGMSDTLVTSGRSTFGYVAQCLGGLEPWVMYRPKNQTAAPDPPCGRVGSMEPCFHLPPTHVTMAHVPYR
ncbi:unnamed protein product [Cuscuta campestris]|uniref:Fucosyltransferase n=1 Tax=Cuscuta campestris TaxID=132261 RepID=A0A484LK97_9ASTE|nr:unnamed protein product [Cuscuta campestris]